MFNHGQLNMIFVKKVPVSNKRKLYKKRKLKECCRFEYLFLKIIINIPLKTHSNM